MPTLANFRQCLRESGNSARTQIFFSFKNSSPGLFDGDDKAPHRRTTFQPYGLALESCLIHRAKIPRKPISFQPSFSESHPLITLKKADRFCQRSGFTGSRSRGRTRRGCGILSEGMHCSRGCPSLTSKQVKKSLSLLKGRHRWRNRALVTLGIRTGLRISELLALRIRDVATQAGPRERIYVARRNTKGKNHGASIILHPQAARAIAKWISVRRNVGPEDWLFPSQMRTGKALGRKSAWEILHRAFIGAGVEGMAGSHCLRKTASARFYRALKGDIFKLSIALRAASNSQVKGGFEFERVDAEIRSRFPPPKP